MTQQYKMLRDSAIEPKAKAGTVVYVQSGNDYGLAADDTRMTGIPHIFVTLNSDGSYPGFTAPVTILGGLDDELLGPDPTHYSGKPFKGYLENWIRWESANADNRRWGLSFCIKANYKGHPDSYIRTSRVLLLDEQTGLCETRNSIYRLIGPEYDYRTTAKKGGGSGRIRK